MTTVWGECGVRATQRKCDECGAEVVMYTETGQPCAWLLDSPSPPGWERLEGVYLIEHYCGKCRKMRDARMPRGVVR